MDKFTTLYFCLAVIVLLPACNKKQTKSVMPPLAIECARATTQQVEEQIWFATSTEPIYSVTIEPRVEGYLRSATYNSGAPVKRGDIIFTIDPTQISTALFEAEASLESARANLKRAYNNYQRAIPLTRINAISQTALDEYTAEYAAAQAAVKSAEQTLKNAQLNMSYATITAPIDGLIAESPANEGDYVGPATKFETLTTISNIDTLKLSLAIPTARYLKYSSGDRSFDNRELLGDITVILPDSSEYEHKGVYDYTQRDVSAGESTIVVVAKIPNPKATLKSEMFTRVRAKIGDKRERILVPQQAVTQMQGVNSVWVIGSDSTVSFRRVSLGDTYGKMWQIKEGVTAGEIVATSGQMKLHQGAKVEYSL